MSGFSDDQRVVITGVGMVTPLGPDRESSWSALVSGECAVSPDGARAPVGEAGEPRAVRFARLAAVEAMLDADVHPPLGVRGGVSVGASKPLLDAPCVMPPETVAHAVADVAGTGGPVMNVSAACATGLHSLMTAAGWIQDGRCESVLAGASESSFHPLYQAGFRRMGVLSPTGRVRPFDRGRDGFVMGEGAGVFYVESLSAARRRGVHIYAELVGWNAGADARHAVRVGGSGGRMAETLSRALFRAGLLPEDLNYINAHGTATILNDALEAEALSGLYRKSSVRPLISSTKGATGHMLGAAGAVEAAFCLLGMRDGRVPPTLRLENPETDFFDFVPSVARDLPIRRAASLSFGFGGALAAVVLEKM